MKTELADEMFSLIEAQVKSRPAPIEFEMAYQVRIAIDRIRFAIKASDQYANRPSQLQEAALQLLDALDRLESADRSFQRHFRSKCTCGNNEILYPSNGSKAGIDHRGQP